MPNITIKDFFIKQKFWGNKCHGAGCDMKVSEVLASFGSLSAFDLHHVNSESKNEAVFAKKSRHIRCLNKEIVDELCKCLMMCGNCHQHLEMQRRMLNGDNINASRPIAAILPTSSLTIGDESFELEASSTMIRFNPNAQNGEPVFNMSFFGVSDVLNVFYHNGQRVDKANFDELVKSFAQSGEERLELVDRAGNVAIRLINSGEFIVMQVYPTHCPEFSWSNDERQQYIRSGQLINTDEIKRFPANAYVQVAVDKAELLRGTENRDISDLASCKIWDFVVVFNTPTPQFTLSSEN